MAWPAQHTGTVCFHLRRIRTRPVGNAVPGVPRSSTEPKQPVRRIRRHPVGRIPPRCRARCGCTGPLRSPRMPSPIPSPSGGGCRPQGRQERENAAGPQCGNDRSCGGMRTVLPSASGHVLPLPSSASRGIGGCHLPPLGEGNVGCGCDGRFCFSLAAAAGTGHGPDAAPSIALLSHVERDKQKTVPFDSQLFYRKRLPFIFGNIIIRFHK